MKNVEELLRPTPGDGERHHADGWVMADPYELSPSALAALRGLIRVIAPPPPAPTSEDLLRRVEHQVLVAMRYLPGAIAKAMSVFFRIIDWAPVWRFKALSRLRNLERARAEAILNGMLFSRSGLVRQIAAGPRGLLAACYYDQDEVQAAMGFSARDWVRSRVALRQRLLAGEKPKPEDFIRPKNGAAQ